MSSSFHVVYEHWTQAVPYFMNVVQRSSTMPIKIRKFFQNDKNTMLTYRSYCKNNRMNEWSIRDGISAWDSRIHAFERSLKRTSWSTWPCDQKSKNAFTTENSGRLKQLTLWTGFRDLAGHRSHLDLQRHAQMHFSPERSNTHSTTKLSRSVKALPNKELDWSWTTY